jgi:hypothetical protein
VAALNELVLSNVQVITVSEQPVTTATTVAVPEIAPLLSVRFQVLSSYPGEWSTHDPVIAPHLEGPGGFGTLVAMSKKACVPVHVCAPAPLLAIGVAEFRPTPSEVRSSGAEKVPEKFALPRERV